MPAPNSSGRPLGVSTKATRKALAVQLGILSDEQVTKMSVVDITTEQILDKFKNPASNGLHDPRMGTTDMGTKCGTCGCGYIECPGHFGSIKLAQAVYHPGYITHIIKVLRCICSSCSRLRAKCLRNDPPLNPGEDEKFDNSEREKIRKIKDGSLRFRKVLDICAKLKRCEHDDKNETGCGEFQPTYRHGGLRIDRIDQDNSAGEARKSFNPDDVREILQRIPDDDLKLIGLDPKHSRPEWMVIKVLAVAPPPVRPSVQSGNGVRSEDDLTFAYREIVKHNLQLQKYMNEGHTRETQDEILSLLQVHVATFMNNNISDAPKAKHLGGRAIKDIRSRLKGKEGRVRGNLMGKRVDFSSRSVITPDPILALDQLGVPQLVAMNLTVPERVTKENIEVMKQLVANGTTRWPGAKFIIRHDGEFIDLSQRKNKTEVDLSPGQIVERQLKDDDYVIFNRQPSLHKMSMMGHRVKVLPFQTFRLNLSVTTPYNADFDGDEMNMHVPQSYETKAEIKEIMHVPQQIVAPKDNKPIMGIVQDSLLGIFLFSQRDTFVEKDLFMNLMMWLDYDGTLPTPCILKPRPLWTGKQVISMVIPKINYQKGGNIGDNYKDECVYIKNGELICGRVNKGVIGNSQGGLIHIVWRDQGPLATRDFMSSIQNVVNNWLSQHGFTIGVQDIIASQQTLDVIKEKLIGYNKQVVKIILEARAGKLEMVTGMGMMDSFESRVNTQLREALNESGRTALKDLAPYNRLQNMVKAGSKGGEFNISQIMACVGQQNVTGKRIPFGFNRRSLPHFSKDDFGPESKGFVFSSYFGGLTPQEFYFHAMGGREGLIDTAVKTADTGYIQRRLIKALEDVQVKYDATVRTSRDQILQFLYGEDGMSSMFIENLKIPLLEMSNTKLKDKYDFFQGINKYSDKKEVQSKQREVLQKFIEEQEGEKREIEDQELEELSAKLEEEYHQIFNDRETLRNEIYKVNPNPESKIYMPVNLERLMWNAREKHDIKPYQKTDLTPQYVIDRVKGLLQNEICVYRANRIEKFSTGSDNDTNLIKDANDDATKLIKIFLRHMLSTKVLIQNKNTRQTVQSFDWLLGEIQDRFEKSLVHPGEMVGCIGAQSIGEPCTQMTLNTFHSAGVGAKNVTLGVPRIREVINVASTLKTPLLRIQLRDPYKKNEQMTEAVGNEITTLTLMDIIASTSIYYDPDPEFTMIQADKQIVESFKNNHLLEESELEKLSPWILRLEIDIDKLQGKHMELSKIERVLREKIPSDETCSLNIIRHTDAEIVKKAVIRLRFPQELLESDEMKSTPQVLADIEKALINELTLRGIPQITKFTFYKIQSQDLYFYDPETGEQKTRKGEFCIETDGVNLKQAMNVQDIEYTTIQSNNIREILTVLGVEATRSSVLHEVRFVLGAYNIYVNYRHLGTLCDIMTNRGVLTAITRHGINRIDSGALRKSSFEETVEILLDSSFHAELDPLSGVTENIIMGQLAPYGTGCFDLMMDTEMIKEANQEQEAPPDFMPDPAQFEDPDMPMTPMIASPEYPQDDPMSMRQGGMSYYDSFSPAPGGGQSYYTPESPSAQIPGQSTAAYGGYAGQGPPNQYSYGTPGQQFGQSPGYGGTSPGYLGGTSPAHARMPGTSPVYQNTTIQGMPQFRGAGMSPHVTSYSPSRPFGGMGGTTPAYNQGMYSTPMGMVPRGATPMGASPAYRPQGQSPIYSPTGNPSMSPAYNYNSTPDEPVYNPKPEDKK